MAREKLNFPSRKKRKELLDSLRAQLEADPQLAQDEKYKAYVNSWVSLDQKMEALSAEDENGVPKLLTNEDADELAAAMLTTAVAGEEFLAAAEFNGQENEPVPQMVEQFQAVLSKDFSTVKKYDQPSGDGGGEREPAGQPAAARTGKPPRGCEERTEQRSDPEFLKYSARKDRSAAHSRTVFSFHQILPLSPVRVCPADLSLLIRRAGRGASAFSSAGSFYRTLPRRRRPRSSLSASDRRR